MNAPATAAPQAGQGPWCDLTRNRWWVIAEDIGAAMTAINSVDADIFPSHLGWQAVVEPCCIRWTAPAQRDDDCEIAECEFSDDDGAVQAWRITVTGT